MQRVLSEQVTKTSVEIVSKLAKRPGGLHRLTATMPTMVAFGALCATAGSGWAGPGQPFWVTVIGAPPGWQKTLSVILAVPAGWAVLALLVPRDAYGAAEGLSNDVGRHGVTAPHGERTAGARPARVCAAGAVAHVVLLRTLIE
jgi:hypothetical protein